MLDSYIPGLNKAAIQFVYKNLMMELSDDEAREQFTKLDLFIVSLTLNFF